MYLTTRYTREWTRCDRCVPESDKELLSVSELVGVSVAALDDRHKLLFIALGALYGPTGSLEILEGILKIGRKAILDGLAELQRANLVTLVIDEAGKPDHYRLLDLIYSFVRSLEIPEKPSHEQAIEAIQGYVTNHAAAYDLP